MTAIYNVGGVKISKMKKMISSCREKAKINEKRLLYEKEQARHLAAVMKKRRRRKIYEKSAAVKKEENVAPARKEEKAISRIGIHHWRHIRLLYSERNGISAQAACMA